MKSMFFFKNVTYLTNISLHAVTVTRGRDLQGETVLSCIDLAISVMSSCILQLIFINLKMFLQFSSPRLVLKYKSSFYSFQEI